MTVINASYFQMNIHSYYEACDNSGYNIN